MCCSLASLQHVGDAARRHREDDDLGGVRGVMRLIAGVQVDVGLRGADGIVAENGAQLGDQVGGYGVEVHDQNPLSSR